MALDAAGVEINKPLPSHADIPLAPQPQPSSAPFDAENPMHHVATVLAALQGQDTTKSAVAQANSARISPVEAPAPAVAVAPDNGTNPAEMGKPLVAQPVPKQPDSAQPAGYGGDNLHSGSWAHDLLATLNIPATEQNVRALTAWQQAEGGGSDGPSHSNFNWLNTTQNAPGASSINKVGVKSYASYHDGLMATAQTLTNGHYDAILGALHAGSSAMAVAQAIEGSPWGTGGGVIRVLGGK